MRISMFLVPLFACSPEEECVPPAADAGEGFLQLTIVGEGLEDAAAYSVPVSWSACGEPLGEGLQTGRIANWVVPAGVLDVVAQDGSWGRSAPDDGATGCHGELTANVPMNGSADQELDLVCD